MRTDGGRSWRVLPDDGMPDALPGEYGFSASGQCITVAGRADAWIATGGSTTARAVTRAARIHARLSGDAVLIGVCGRRGP